jgi:pyruvate dehydrogenase E2 component (dihydrolipoamide acetyltransferase)
MATQVKLPRLGQGMDEGKVLQWLKAEGESIDKGEELYEVETEKVNVEVESPAAGTVLKVLVPAGETVAIGTTLAWIGEPGEDVPSDAGDDSAADARGSSVSPTGESATAPTPATEAPAPKAAASSAAAAPSRPAPAASGPGERRIKASPLARRMAAEQGLELSDVPGSGPDGRVIARDVEQALQAGSAAAAAAPQPVAAGPGVERIELTSMRRTIARRLGEAWQAPSFILDRSIDMTAANELRARMLRSVADGDVRPTVSDIITKACAVALRRHPQMNAHWNEDSILQFEAAHVGLAVATDAGLVVPVIRDAHAKTVREIATDRKALVDKARAGKLQPMDFEGGTFSISNLGMMGIDRFTAVLNPPQAGILAVGATVDTPVVVDRRVEVRPIMQVSLTCDHRTVDGAVGARFLQALVEHLEDPTSML